MEKGEKGKPNNRNNPDWKFLNSQIYDALQRQISPIVEMTENG